MIGNFKVKLMKFSSYFFIRYNDTFGTVLYYLIALNSTNVFFYVHSKKSKSCH